MRPPTCCICSTPTPLPALIRLCCHQTGQIIATSDHYCSTTCRNADARNHDPICKIVQLYRAGDLLQAAFYTYREVGFDLQIKGVSKSSDILHAYEGWYGDDQDYPPLFDFPNALVSNAEDKAKLLTLQACTDAIDYMFELSKELLKDITSSVEEASLGVPSRYYKIKRYFEDGMPDNRELRRLALAVDAPDGKAYIIDPSGAQFGQTRAVVPFEDYLEEYAEQLIRINPHGTAAADMAKVRAGEWDHKLSPFQDMRIHHVQHEVHGRFVQAVEQWEKGKKMKVRGLLSVSEQEYEKGKASFLEKVAMELKKWLIEWKMGGCQVKQHRVLQDNRPSLQDMMLRTSGIQEECTIGSEDAGSTAYWFLQDQLERERVYQWKMDNDTEFFLKEMGMSRGGSGGGGGGFAYESYTIGG